MIWESCYWKADLLRYAANLQKKMRQRRWSEPSQVVVEKTVFIGFYSIRKLFEAKKLSSSLHGHTISITAYPPTSKPATLRNWHKTDELFHLDRGKSASVTLPFLCDQVIHSYIFQLGFINDNTLDFMLLCSDRQRTKALQQISFRDVVAIFERVGNDNPCESSIKFNPRIKDYEVYNK